MNEPARNAIGSTIRFATPDAPSEVLLNDPASRPIAMNAKVPQATNGMPIHHDPVSFNPNAATARPRKIAIWSSAIARLTNTRANTIDRVETGASRNRRNSFVLRHCTSVSAAPNVALVATAQPSRPGVTYWIDLSESSSTWRASSVYTGGLPLAATLAASTNAPSVPRTVAALTWS